MPNDKKKTDSENKGTIINGSLPSLFVDGIGIGPRNDNTVFIRLLSGLPEGSYEQARFFVLNENLIKFIDALCESIEYYPTKPKKKTAKHKEKS